MTILKTFTASFLKTTISDLTHCCTEPFSCWLCCLAVGLVSLLCGWLEIGQRCHIYKTCTLELHGRHLIRIYIEIYKHWSKNLSNDHYLKLNLKKKEEGQSLCQACFQVYMPANWNMLTIKITLHLKAQLHYFVGSLLVISNIKVKL